ncbi:hypothetical protein BKE56_023910 [Rhodococcus sp. M8]|nr:hypothetical protein BKE56_023910 [Rhodococcus sp. M8]
MVTGILVARTHDAGDVIGAVEQLLQPTLPSSLFRVRYLTAGRALPTFARARASERTLATASRSSSNSRPSCQCVR